MWFVDLFSLISFFPSLQNASKVVTWSMKSMLFSCVGRGKAIFLLATFALSAIRRKFFFSCIYLMRFCMIVLFFPLLCLLLLSLKKIIDITRKLSRFCFLIFKFHIFFGQKIRKSHLASFFKSVSYTVANMNSNRNEYLFRHWI